MVESRPDLDGRFTGMQRIGQNGGGGQFSLLFNAYDRLTHQRVALKFFDPEARGRQDSMYRWACFQREARLLEDLAGQPDIIAWVAPLSQFSELLQTQVGPYPIDFAYYAMELAARSIADVIAETASNPAPPEWRLIAFRQMCRAVQRIHKQRIVHRDLKPGNFLIMPDGSTVKLSDLGTARRLDDPAAGPLQPSYSWPQGDLTYAPPEMVATLHDIDPAVAFRGDMYALGAILFELFSGYVLAPQIYEPTFVAWLNQLMRVVPTQKRQETYDGFVANLAVARPLPSVGDFGVSVPASIRDQVNRLYQSMAALDYRKRDRDFASTAWPR